MSNNPHRTLFAGQDESCNCQREKTIINDRRKLVDFWTQSAQEVAIGDGRPRYAATRQADIADSINGYLHVANQCIGQRLGVRKFVATSLAR